LDDALLLGLRLTISVESLSSPASKHAFVIHNQHMKQDRLKRDSHDGDTCDPSVQLVPRLINQEFFSDFFDMAVPKPRRAPCGPYSAIHVFSTTPLKGVFQILEIFS
jgi:hypothetical protein